MEATNIMQHDLRAHAEACDAALELAKKAVFALSRGKHTDTEIDSVRKATALNYAQLLHLCRSLHRAQLKEVSEYGYTEYYNAISERAVWEEARKR